MLNMQTIRQRGYLNDTFYSDGSPVLMGDLVNMIWPLESVEVVTCPKACKGDGQNLVGCSGPNHMYKVSFPTLFILTSWFEKKTKYNGFVILTDFDLFL